jgi:cell division protein FtsB
VNDQIRGAVLGAIAAVMGWLAITSVGLLVQVSVLQVTTTAQKEQISENSARDHRTEERILAELKALRTLIEDYHGRK